ncbi:MAG: DNA modification methylase [Alphaproteobacteria bacterium]|nr:DNA modification methylase [Alphaproteobacteria bacterium]
MSPTERRDDSTTFTPNQRLAVHRWFRYSAGFSGAWAADVVAEALPRGGVVFDPFAGVATTLIAAQSQGCDAVGVEAHPLVTRIARAKLDWSTPPAAFSTLAEAVHQAAATLPTTPLDAYPELVRRIFEDDALAELDRLKRAIDAHADPDTPAGRLCWLALLAILRSCSGAGTAPWQYVLPDRRKAQVASPLPSFAAQCRLMAEDMASLQRQAPAPGAARLLQADARTLEGVADASVDLVLTSPPYPNNYDYADATRVELSFLGEVERWADLHDAVRQHLLRSCSQHTRKERLEVEALLDDPLLGPIRPALDDVCARLSALRAERKGHKAYDTMIAAYFADLARVWQALGRVCRPGARACFVIGDSAPYGVYVPVDLWLGVLAEATGFAVEGFEQTRARNIKWKNRKHRVPLKEGHLRVRRV